MKKKKININSLNAIARSVLIYANAAETQTTINRTIIKTVIDYSKIIITNLKEHQVIS
jgi:hypothetical protein